MSCSLFVPEVRGSSRCSVCHRNVSEHQPEAIYVQPQQLFATFLPSNSLQKSASSRSTQMRSAKTPNSLLQSENSAFSPFPGLTKMTKKEKVEIEKEEEEIYSTVPDESDESTRFSPLSFQKQFPQVVLRPQARHAPSINDSVITKKIRGKRKERPSSAGFLDFRQAFEKDEKEEEKPPQLPRSHDFKRILQRFQSADRRNTLHGIYHDLNQFNNNNRMSPALQNSWGSPHRMGSSDSWSPIHRSSLNSNYRESPTGSRNTSSRSKLSAFSARSPPISYLPTMDCSPRSGPSPSMIPQRPSSSPSSPRGSPLSHTGSTPEPTLEIPLNGKPINVRVRSPRYGGRRGSQPEVFSSPLWVKETDVDEPLSLPMSPIGSSSSETHLNIAPIRSAPMSKLPSMEKLDSRKNSMRVGGSVRRALNAMDKGPLLRRSKSKDERSQEILYVTPPTLNHSNRTSSIPMFLSQESITHSSPLTSPLPPHPKSGVNDEVLKKYQQMALSHVQTLTTVLDQLNEDARRGEEPVSRNRLTSLHFGSFIFQNPQPALTKGKSVFYHAVLPRQNMPDYPVTLMIAPCSQYAPLMRKTESNLFSLPTFLELEDSDNETIQQFLYDTGIKNLGGRNTKLLAMPRLNLCSFHTLAAHQLNQRIEPSLHEELVSFILLQLLSALKMLQGEGVESLSTNFKEFLLAYRYPNMSNGANFREFPRLLFLPDTLGAEIESGSGELVGLCRYALRSLCTLMHFKMDGKAPPMKLKSQYSRALLACALILQEDKSNSLTKAKNVLELSLWSGGQFFKNEADAMVWIDVARADCVDTLLRRLILEPSNRFDARERFQIDFLLGATPRGIIDSQKATMSADII